MSDHLTYKFRIKDATTAKYLNKMASSVNFVWNYCNEISMLAVKRDGKWLSEYDLQRLASGCTKELGLQSSTIQNVCKEYATRRKQFRKFKLKWRSKKRSLGWIPFKEQSIRIFDDVVVYNKQEFRIWKSREIYGMIQDGCFTQDARGRWYICLTCLAPVKENPGTKDIGIDLGLKTQVTCSDGRKFERANYFKKMENKLAMAQRAHKKKQVRGIHAKIANARKDWNHKVSTEILKTAKTVIVGDVSSLKLLQTKLAKSVSDAAWSQLKSMFAYKAERLGIDFRVQNESYSTQNCSSCEETTGPKGLTELGVREWVCECCGTIHDRDVNAAKNILRMGLHALVGNSFSFS